MPSVRTAQNPAAEGLTARFVLGRLRAGEGLLLLLEIIDTPQLRLVVGWPFLVVLNESAGRRYGLKDLLKLPIIPLCRADGAYGDVSVGRGAGCDVRIQHASISTRHARFRQRPDGGWQVIDEVSTNGTTVSGDRLTPGVPADVAEGTIIRFGAKKCAFGSASLQRLLSKMIAKRNSVFEQTIAIGDED